MMKVKAKVYIYEKRFDGFPKDGDLKLIEEDLPPIENGEFLAEAKALSVDPYMRAYSSRLPLGIPFIGIQVAQVIESKNPRFPVGSHIVASFGWRSHTISNGKPVAPNTPGPMILPDFKGLPLSLGVGALGMPGNTAYFGFLELCRPKAGDTVVVTGAAGAVGSHVGQIAKIKGCKVIGIAGSAEKGKWLTDELKFDHFINYKTDDIDKVLSEIAPAGVDCYFDNVGGEVSSIILEHMKDFGRVSVCGSISGYNDTSLPKATILEGIQQNLKWIKEGKLKYRETITEGFDNMFKAFVDMLKGGNVGKAVVVVK